MRILLRYIVPVCTFLSLLCGIVSCNSVDDDRIPTLPVNLNLSDPGVWNRYGVMGFGIYKYFIPGLQQPSGFTYTVGSAAGFGGVLLIGGMDPFSGDTQTPLAYDLSCPVECKPDIRVKIDDTTFEAICPECKSHYDVTMRGGVPVSGPACGHKRPYSLRRYQCFPSQYGGYVITN